MELYRGKRGEIEPLLIRNPDGVSVGEEAGGAKSSK